MLVHICCSVDSHYFLHRLRQDYPGEDITGYFYNPNIHPYSEYLLRLTDVRRSCRIYGVELIEEEYDLQSWLKDTEGLEKEPEKGARCEVCFSHRLKKSAAKAAERGEKLFTSTLLLSPKKSRELLTRTGIKIAHHYGISFISPDYRKNSGTQEQNMLARRDKLYRQNYCGCLFALKQQREQQNRDADELYSPLSGQIQPGSIEERLAIYEKRVYLEEKKKFYRIVRERFLKWRLLSLIMRTSDGKIAAHALPYSTIKHGRCKGRIEFSHGNIHFMNRDEVKFIELDYYNTLGRTNYKKTEDLIFSPPAFEEELSIKRSICGDPMSLSAVFVVNRIPSGKVDIEIGYKTVQDLREKILHD